MARGSNKGHFLLNSGGNLLFDEIDQPLLNPSLRFEAQIPIDVRGRKREKIVRQRAMAFAQLTYRESLRDIETCLGAVGGKLAVVAHKLWNRSKGLLG